MSNLKHGWRNIFLLYGIIKVDRLKHKLILSFYGLKLSIKLNTQNILYLGNKTFQWDMLTLRNSPKLQLMTNFTGNTLYTTIFYYLWIQSLIKEKRNHAYCWLSSWNSNSMMSMRFFSISHHEIGLLLRIDGHESVLFANDDF